MFFCRIIESDGKQGRQEVHQQEVEYFIEAVRLFKDNLLIDAIGKFRELITKFPNSDLADDAKYNIALSYFNINQLDKAVEELKQLINEYPEGTITALDNTKEFGKTSAKALYLLVNCFLGLRKVDEAKRILPELVKYKDSYVEENGRTIPFHDLAENAINIYVSMNKS
jgi:TolA-binding protein